jgi:hypothetical protein
MSAQHQYEHELHQHHRRRRRRRRRLSGTDWEVFQGIQSLPNTTTTPTTTPYVTTIPSKHWTFVHIPKTAGDSFMKDSPQHMPIGASLQGNFEDSLRSTNRTWPLMVFFRDPTNHVLSQFLECKYDTWGQRQTKGTGFPGYIPNNAAANNANKSSNEYTNVLQGFDEWVQHFVYHACHPDAWKPQYYTLNPPPPGQEQHYGQRVGFNCYDPVNMQSRYMTMAEGGHYASHPYHRFPNATDAIQAMSSAFAVVGIVEYYAASVCLWEYHAGGRQFLTRSCQVCVENNDGNSNSNGKLLLAHKPQTHESHGVPPHSVSMISKETLQQIEQHLTVVDRQLYQASVERFLHDVDVVYQETGVDLLCRPKSKQPQPQNGYSTTTTNTTTTFTVLPASSSSASSSQTISILERYDIILSMVGLLAILMLTYLFRNRNIGSGPPTQASRSM